MNIDVENVGKIYAKYINIVFTLPKRCVNEQTFDRRENGIVQITVDNKVRDLVIPENAQFFFLSDMNKPKQFGPARHEPLLPGMQVRLRSIPINQYATDPNNEISWIIYADNAESKTGRIQFSAIEQI